jgi:RNA polymerase sigma-70 factor, ECF subfamily
MIEKEIRFKKLVKENEERIRRICSYYAPTAEDSNDMYQEVLINTWKSLDSFRGDSAPGTWMYRIAVNTSLSFSGKHYKRMKLNVDLETTNIQDVLEQDEDQLIRQENLELLQAELNQLSFIEMALMGLVIEGLSTKEISEVIGITESNVRVRIHRIKNELRDKISYRKNILQ